MASFYDTTIGQQVEFHRVLASAGFTDKDVARIIKEPSLASAMYGAIQPLTKPYAAMPSWWRTPEQQLERARQLWPDTVLPEPPKEFVRRTQSEVLLLHVPDTFDSLWDKVVASVGYVGGRDWHEEDGLRLVRKVEYMTPVWLGFDPEHGRGQSARSFQRHGGVAASEVLSALIQFPDWSLSWLSGAATPLLNGYRVGGQSIVPYIYLWNEELDTLRLATMVDYICDDDCASPTVREC